MPLADPLLPPKQIGTWHHVARRSELRRGALYFLLLSALALLLGWVMSWLLGDEPLAPPRPHSGAGPAVLALEAAPGFLYGVSLGGWLLIEINPSTKSEAKPDVRPQWMFDELEAASELDFVSRLRETSDAFAVRTMQNHWRHYLGDGMLEHAAALGVNAVRIPVGYWIMDAPVGGSSPLEYGISPEGFVTGGLNHLQAMLRVLARHKMVALVDMHALPCNSACVSDGLDCANPLAFAPDAPVGDIERCTGQCSLFAPDGTPEECAGPICAGVRRCDGQTFPTRRVRRAGTTWRDVGLDSLAGLAAWLALLPAPERSAVAALQLANEPALNSKGYDAAVKSYYTAAVARAREALPSLPLVLSFIPPNDFGVPAFVRAFESLGYGPLVIDHHWYLNWATPPGEALSWGEIHRRACREAEESWQAYAALDVQLVLGEWSLATNHDAPRDLSDGATVAQLRQLFREQLSVFAAAPGVRGAFYWSLRMGSGWDPRPTERAPNGTQREGSSAWRSRDGYPFRVWSLLEMAAAGVLPGRIDDAAALAGACDGV